MARRARPSFSFSVEPRPFPNAARFVTVDAADPIWDAPPEALAAPPSASGAFVRVRPPRDAEDARVEAVAAALRQVARAVRVQPRAAAQVVAPPTDTRVSVASHREVAMAIVDESRSPEKEQLRAIVDSVLAEVGI